MINVYIASPLHTDDYKYNISKITKLLRRFPEKYKVYSPMELTIENAWDISITEWGYQVYRHDMDALKDCDVVVCLYYGFNSSGSTGTSFEVGYAKALGKRIVTLIPNLDTKLSLMVMNASDIVLEYHDFNELISILDNCDSDKDIKYKLTDLS